MLIGNDSRLEVVTEVGKFSMEEDKYQQCIHIWVSDEFLDEDDYCYVTTDGDHTQIFKNRENKE